MTTDLDAYLSQFKPRMMECFARFVISQGYGAVAPTGETWQACGQRLFGQDFKPVLLGEIRKMEQST